MAFPGLIAGAAVGLAAMYVFDPETGRRRRARARDKVVRFRTQAKRTAAVTARDLRNRTTGVLAEARGFVLRQETDDRSLEERVRSHLGYLVRHPASVAVQASDGHVTLTGPVLADEVQQLLRGVKSVRGVVHVENRVDVHDRPGDVPGLQGDIPRPSPRTLDLAQARWSPATRFSAGVAGTLLLLKLSPYRKSAAALAALAALAYAARSTRQGRSDDNVGAPELGAGWRE